MRQFVSSRMPDAHGTIALTEKEYRYLACVLRLAGGTNLEVRLPDGTLLPAAFCAEKAFPRLQIIAPPVHSYNQPERPDIWLFQFLPKVQKIDLIVRQAAECGVGRIIPIQGSYSPPYAPRLERWRRIIREARQQSGSPVATEISEPLSVTDAAQLWEQHKKRQFAAAFILCEKEEGQKSIFSLIEQTAAGMHCKAGGCENRPLFFTALAVGCEGGISTSEKLLLKDAGFMPIHFKTNILRTETAALYGLAAIQNAVMEYNEWKSKE